MSVYLVTWDINKARANYSTARAKLIAHLQTYDHTRDPGLDSVWFLSTQKSADQVSEGILVHLDNNDRCIITRLVSGQHQGWLSQDIWDWINARIRVPA